jgi:hypothetical protein
MKLNGTALCNYFAVLTLCLGGLVLNDQPSAVAADDVSLEKVVDAWRQRQQQTNSFRIQWEEKHLQAQGAMALPPEPRAIAP